MNTPEPLASYQNQLFRALFEHSQAEDVQAVLDQFLEGEVDESLKNYIRAMQPEMLELAAVIFKKWGCRGGPDCRHSWPKRQADS